MKKVALVFAILCFSTPAAAVSDDNVKEFCRALHKEIQSERAGYLHAIKKRNNAFKQSQAKLDGAWARLDAAKRALQQNANLWLAYCKES